MNIIRFSFFILCFLTFSLQAQIDTINYYYDKESYHNHAVNSFLNLSENEYTNKKIKIYSIPLYCFNDSIKNYCCGKNLETMIDFTQRVDLQTIFAVKKNNIVFYQVLLDRFYEEIETGNIHADKERFNRNNKLFDEDNISHSDGNFYPFMLLKGVKKETFFQKIGNVFSRKRFQYKKLWKFIDKHPDAQVFQITYVPGYWAIINKRLIRISDGKKIKISEANTYFCKSYTYCAVRLVYGKDSLYYDQQEECEKQKYSWPKCDNCNKCNFQNIILINDVGK